MGDFIIKGVLLSLLLRVFFIIKVVMVGHVLLWFIRGWVFCGLLCDVFALLLVLVLLVIGLLGYCFLVLY